MSRLLIIATAVATAVAFAASMSGAAVTRDRRPPTAPLVVGARTTTNASPAYRFSARDNRTPARALRFRCAFDSRALRACPRVYRAQLTLGQHVLRVQALDRAGNRSRTTVVNVLVLPALSPAHVLATVPVADPGRMTFAADGSLWVNRKARSTDGTSVNGTVSRIDPATNRVTGTVKVADGGGTGIGFGFGSVWAVNFSSASVSRIDPATGVLLATIPDAGTGSPPVGVAFTSQAVWVAEHEPEGFFVKIDPATNRIINRVAVGEPPPAGGPAWITSAAGSVWGAASGEVVRFDPVGDKVLAEIKPCGLSVAQIATDGSTVWVSCGERRPELSRVDPATNKIATAVTAGALAQYGLGGVYSLAFGGGMLWLSLPCVDAACVLAIDPASNTIAKAWTVVADVENAGLTLAYGDGSLWITGRDGVLRIDPGS